MAINLGSIIWTAVRAILKFVLTAACGTFLARAKFLDAAGTRAISQCILNVFLPCLVFSKIVQGIDQQHMKQVGVLVLTAIMYTLLGLAFALLVRFCTRVPKGWSSGILAAGAYSNWGDLPIVLIGTIVSAAPFSGSLDEAKGLAYISVYMFVQNTIMFACNGIWLIKRDFINDVDPSEKSAGLVSNVHDLGRRVRGVRQRLATSASFMHRDAHDCESISHESTSRIDSSQLSSTKSPLSQARRRTSFRDQDLQLRRGESLGLAAMDSSEDLYLRPIISGVMNQGDLHATVDGSEISRIPSSRLPRTIDKTLKNTPRERNRPISSTSSSAVHGMEGNEEDVQSGTDESKRLIVWRKTKTTLSRFCTPPSLATLSGFVIAVVPELKALFVPVEGVSMPLAPDAGQPLSFLLDTTNFIGNASVPCSLLILGYSLSRLRVDKVPALAAAIGMSCCKLIVLPVIAIAWMQFLASDHGGLVDPQDLVLRLCLVLPAAVPTATALLYITQIFAPEGREEGVQCLSVFLIVQYLMVAITLTIVVVYTLKLIS